MATIFRTMRLATFLLALVACYAANANADVPCPDTTGIFPAACTKEIRIWNNTGGTIYVLLQGSIETQPAIPAINCSAAKGGGDVWLQAALGDYTKCHAVNNTYHVYINPTTGIPNEGFVSINVPWWSKRAPPTPDLYIDWWRAGRVIIYDDKTALDDSYLKELPALKVKMAAGSPVVSCKSITLNGRENSCLPGQLQIYQVTPAAEIAAKTPFQLNEFTFADVKSVDAAKDPGSFIDFNQNYNVSDVDQVYLPVAIGPVRQPADIGYLGTTISVAAFRETLRAFTGSDVNPTNPANWPIYNNPMVSGKPTYPNAGIRVPSALAVFNYYMNPAYFPGPSKIPEIIPAAPPKLVTGIMTQWTNCTTGKGNCPQSAIYKEINAAFATSYASYILNCTPPSYLMPIKGSMPPAPSLYAYLRFVHGWVPFNVAAAETACNVPELPVGDMPPAGNRTPIDYINIQYNFQNPALTPNQWFNPYTQFIHGEVVQGGLAANAYAFSIDDRISFLSNDGGTTPGGLILAVGGANGLENKTQAPPPTPPYNPYFDFVVSLAAPSVMDKAPQWAKYGICSPVANTMFPPSSNGAQNLGVDPAVENISNSEPCPITLTDTNNKQYQMIILKAGIPPSAIWPKFTANGDRSFDPLVVSCPTQAGVVLPAAWCNFTNELAAPGMPPTLPAYSLSARGPVP